MRDTWDRAIDGEIGAMCCMCGWSSFLMGLRKKKKRELKSKQHHRLTHFACYRKNIKWCLKNGNRIRRCSKDGDFNLRGRRFWWDEKDGDSDQKPESWQVAPISLLTRGLVGLPANAKHRRTWKSGTYEMLWALLVLWSLLIQELHDATLDTLSNFF